MVLRTAQSRPAYQMHYLSISINSPPFGSANLVFESSNIVWITHRRKKVRTHQSIISTPLCRTVEINHSFFLFFPNLTQSRVYFHSTRNIATATAKISIRTKSVTAFFVCAELNITHSKHTDIRAGDELCVGDVELAIILRYLSLYLHRRALSQNKSHKTESVLITYNRTQSNMIS